MDPAFFATPGEWRAWPAEHHDTVPGLWVGFHKKASGRPSITWPEAVDQAGTKPRRPEGPRETPSTRSDPDTRR
jgi:hypothetical protein